MQELSWYPGFDCDYIRVSIVAFGVSMNDQRPAEPILLFISTKWVDGNHGRWCLKGLVNY